MGSCDPLIDLLWYPYAIVMDRSKKVKSFRLVAELVGNPPSWRHGLVVRVRVVTGGIWYLEARGVYGDDDRDHDHDGRSEEKVSPPTR